MNTTADVERARPTSWRLNIHQPHDRSTTWHRPDRQLRATSNASPTSGSASRLWRDDHRACPFVEMGEPLVFLMEHRQSGGVSGDEQGVDLRMGLSARAASSSRRLDPTRDARVDTHGARPKRHLPVHPTTVISLSAASSCTSSYPGPA